MGREFLPRLLQHGALTTVFQPIVELDDGSGPRPELDGRGVSIVGFECLTRGPAGTNMEHPGVLFEYVRRKRAATLIDRLCVTSGLEHARDLGGEVHLAFNVHASTLGLDGRFGDFLERSADHFGIALDRLTVEVVEHAPAWDGEAFELQLADLRRRGVSIALDDVGLGYANYRMLLETRPDLLKVDRYLVQGIDDDPYRRAILDSLQRLAEACGARLVVEGVERPQELDAVRQLGVRLVQGFLFGLPGPASDFLGDLPKSGSRIDLSISNAPT